VVESPISVSRIIKAIRIIPPMLNSSVITQCSDWLNWG
jgi:hypothetical protein